MLAFALPLFSEIKLCKCKDLFSFCQKDSIFRLYNSCFRVEHSDQDKERDCSMNKGRSSSRQKINWKYRKKPACPTVQRDRGHRWIDPSCQMGLPTRSRPLSGQVSSLGHLPPSSPSLSFAICKTELLPLPCYFHTGNNISLPGWLGEVMLGRPKLRIVILPAEPALSFPPCGVLISTRSDLPGRPTAPPLLSLS